MFCGLSALKISLCIIIAYLIKDMKNGNFNKIHFGHKLWLRLLVWLLGDD